MPQFPVNVHRFDPFKNFKFLVYCDGTLVAGVSKVGALKRTTEVVKYRGGGDNAREFKSPGRTSYDSFTLERGLTFDHEFERWASTVHSFAGDNSVSLLNYKKDITVELNNLQNTPVLRYFCYQCWVSAYTALPDLSAGENAVAIESLTLEPESWERDEGLAEALET